MFRAFYLQLAAICCVFAMPQVVQSQDSGFGRRQVEQMLADRPDMKGVIGPEHPIYQWVVDGFQGKLIGQRVYWNANSPRSGRPAEHALPYASYPPYISISGGTETTAIDKWSSVVFELSNLQNHEQFTRLTSEALAGKLSADEYATQCVMLEYDAQIRTKSVFAASPLPESTHGRDPWYNSWIKGELLAVEDFKAKHAVPGSTHCNFDYFKSYFVSNIAPYLKATKKLTEEPKPQ